MDTRGSGRSGQAGGRGRDRRPQDSRGPQGASGQRGGRQPNTLPSRHYPHPLDTQRGFTSSPEAAFAHPGLAFQRFIWYDRQWQMEQKHQARILNELATQTQVISRESSTFNKALKALHTRTDAAQQMLSEAGWQVHSLLGTVEWRLVTGLGAAGILEGSGMVLHRLYGFPYLPGSSLKGLVRHYLWIEERRDDVDPVIERMFGSQGQRGAVMFWDALPEAWPTLDVDIINVHVSEYYRQERWQDQLVPPADYLSPNPVYFLTVAAGTKFRFRLLSREPELLESTADYTRKALELLGFGAKTRAGYGGMTVAEG
jgi:CRISPR-associated protein Cmr6